jgi:hypothetical protein
MLVKYGFLRYRVSIIRGNFHSGYLHGIPVMSRRIPGIAVARVFPWRFWICVRTKDF